MSWKKRLVFIVAAAVFSWLLVEAAVFGWLLYDGFQIDRGVKVELVNEMPNNLAPHPHYIWRYMPGSHYVYRDTRDNYPFSVVINSEGFRDEEPAERSAARFRFLALGDSFTFGWMVEKQDRWDEVLAGLIAERTGVPAVSINRGMWMATFDQHALVLEGHMPERCDAVIHFVYPSHLQTINRHIVEYRDGRIERVYDPLLHLKGTGLYFGAADEKLVQKKLTFPFTLCLISFYRNVRLLREQVPHEYSVPEMTDEQIYQKHSQHVFEHGWKLTGQSIRQIAAFLREREIPYYVVIVPRDRQLAPQEWNDVEPIAEILTTSVPQDRLRRICEGTSCARVLDLLPLMRASYSPNLYHRHDAHWSPAGHRLAAKAVYQRLVEDGLPSAGLDQR